MASCDPATLIANAGCFECFSGVMLRAFQVRMLCFDSGFVPGCDPTGIADHAKCLASCASDWQAMKVWLLATHLGLNPNDQSLVDNANCLLSCLTDYQMDLAITGLIVNLTASTFDPVVLTKDNLPDLANCILNCLPIGYMDAAIVVIIAESIGLSTDPQFLSDQVNCLRCKPYSLLKAMEVYLWCLERDQA